ncbi:MAG: hypothetical protein WBX00_26145 [Isosphaeraceae bacterium]
MYSLGRAGMMTWVVLTFGYLAYPGTTLAQRRDGGFLQGFKSKAFETTPGFGGRRDGEPPMMNPVPSGVGPGRRFGRGDGRPGGPGGPSYNLNPPYYLPGQTYGGPYPNQSLPNTGQPYQTADGNWYYPDGRPYSTASAPTLANPGRPYLAADGNWYYPDGRPYSTASAPTVANPGSPYLATDGNWYYPDGRPYSTTETTAPRPTTAAAEVTPVANVLPDSERPTAAAPTAPAPVTPAVNVLPDLERPTVLENNLVRTQVSAAPPSIRNDLAQELVRSLEEGMDRLENSLREALFSEADEAAFLAIYKRSFTEDTPQFRLARKNIKYLDADELLQGLIIDGVVDAGAQVYPAKLELSAKFGTLKRAVLDDRSIAEYDRSVKGLLKTYQQVARSPAFNELKVPDHDQIQAELAKLRHIVELRQRLVEAKETTIGGMITMDKRFRIVSYPGLPKDTVQAIDSQVCLWGTGSGMVEVRDAELLDLGVPLLKCAASPLPETPRPPAPTGTVVYNPKDSPVTVHYVIDGAPFQLKPGESRSHEVKANSRFTYNRGETLGNVTYQLIAGTYKFSIQDRAWQVTKGSFSVVIDNSANGYDFHCEVDGQPRVIPPQKTLELASNYPMSIRFDRGHGQGTACKLIDESLKVTVGVAPGSAGLDLFLGTSQELCLHPTASESITSQAQPGLAMPPKLGRQSVLPTVDDLR